MSSRIVPAALALAALVVAASAVAQEVAAKPAIQPKALRVLKIADEFLQTAPRIRFKAYITHDHVMPSGQKIQHSAA